MEKTLRKVPVPDKFALKIPVRLTSKCLYFKNACQSTFNSVELGQQKNLEKESKNPKYILFIILLCSCYTIIISQKTFFFVQFIFSYFYLFLCLY